MVKKMPLENGRIFNFQGLMTLTLHHSSTSAYMPNLTEVKNFLQTDGRTYVRTYGQLRLTLLDRLRVDLKRQCRCRHSGDKGIKNPNSTMMAWHFWLGDRKGIWPV